MKVFFFLLTVFCMLILDGCDSESSDKEYSKQEEIVIETQLQIAGQLCSKHEMSMYADTFLASETHNIINKVEMIFQTYRILSLEEARKILVDCIETFLSKLNSNEEIRPYLKKYPLTPQNINIVIWTIAAEGSDAYNPGIEAASSIEGKIRYVTEEKSQKRGYKSEYKETFEEALESVKRAQGSEG